MLFWFSGVASAVRHGAVDEDGYSQAFPCGYRFSPLPGFGMDGDPFRGVHTWVRGRGSGLDLGVGVSGLFGR